jgi:hypothetical protein
MQTPIRYLVLLVVGLTLSSCVGNFYKVKVNGYTSPATNQGIKPGGAFFVVANKEAKNPLLEMEVKDKIQKLLQGHGYPLTSFETADYYLFFSYGLGEPRNVSVVVPDYYGSIGWGGGWGPGYGWGGPAFYFTVPPWGGYAETTIYDRWLLINVVDGPAYRAHQGSQPVWVGEARSLGTSADLRTVLNYLLVADFQEFGKNTGKAITIKLEEENPAVYSLIHSR